MSEHTPEAPVPAPYGEPMPAQDEPALAETPAPALLNSKEISESLTGFEEIGIKQAFGVSADKLDGSMGGRALLFTARRRADPNLKAPDAYKQVMTLGAKQLDDLFEDVDDEDEDEASESGEGDGPLS